jgi:hypothetical protein
MSGLLCSQAAVRGYGDLTAVVNQYGNANRGGKRWHALGSSGKVHSDFPGVFHVEHQPPITVAMNLYCQA